MIIENIEFEQGADGAIPSRITATMTRDEAAAIAKVFGGFSDGELVKRGLPHGLEIYSALVGDVFNRYYEDGLNDVWKS